ncbi:hypothetical protein ADT35_21525, partial [Yersinia pestis subsp. microtus bv. Talassica]
FWFWIIGFFVAFMPLYVLGFMGMTRRLSQDINPEFPSKMTCTNVGMVTTIQSVPKDVAPLLATALYDVVASYVTKELT